MALDINKLGPHLALCHEENSSANLRPVALLMKSDGVEITAQVIKSMIALGLEVPDEMVSSICKNEDGEMVSAKDYAYVKDVLEPDAWKLRIDKATHVEKSVAAIGEGFHGDEIPEDDLPAVIMKVRAAYEKFFPENELPMILKSKDEVELDKEIQESIDLLKSQLTEKETALAKALAELDGIKQVQAEALSKARKDKLATVVSDTEVDALFKSLELLNDESFDVVFKSLEAKSNIEKNTELFNEIGVNGDGDVNKQVTMHDLVAQKIEKSKKKTK